ncbi:hypothetical protein J3Q64DRAFT_1705648 [Phycomyces blakesleeanus]|uniref:Uncharacterized protein n=1 Tax=Phycomyces blakesleeanus TaxID=4837 RepID=A0ABR3BAV4_PHYBL
MFQSGFLLLLPLLLVQSIQSFFFFFPSCMISFLLTLSLFSLCCLDTVGKPDFRRKFYGTVHSAKVYIMVLQNLLNEFLSFLYLFILFIYKYIKGGISI